MSNLKPMQIGEILDGTFAIYRRHFRLFVQLSLIVMCVPTVAWVYFQVRYTGGNSLELMALIQDRPLLFFTVIFGLALVSLAAGLLLKAGSIRVISDSFLGQEPQLASALSLGASKIVPLFLVALGKTILIAILFGLAGGAVAVITGLVAAGSRALAVLVALAGGVGAVWGVVWVACGYGVTTPAVVLEDLASSFDSFGRSWDLTRAARGKVFVVSVVAYMIGQLLPGFTVGIINAILAATNPNLTPVTVILASFITILLAPILPCALTLLYYDLRVRREAFDLQVLSQQLGIT